MVKKILTNSGNLLKVHLEVTDKQDQTFFSFTESVNFIKKNKNISVTKKKIADVLTHSHNCTRSRLLLNLSHVQSFITATREHWGDKESAT